MKIQRNLLQQESATRRNEFKLLATYFRDLWRKGCLLTNLWSYWAVSVILIGGIGVWTSMVLAYLQVTTSSVLLSLITLSPPVATTACLEFLFLSDEEQFLKGPAIFAGLFVGLIAVLSVVLMKTWLSYVLAILAILFACILSWFACACDPKFTEQGNYSAPVGGETTKAIEGSEKGFSI